MWAAHAALPWLGGDGSLHEWRTLPRSLQVAEKASDLFHFGIVDVMEPMIGDDGGEVPLATYFNLTTVPAIIYFQVPGTWTCVSGVGRVGRGRGVGGSKGMTT